MIQEIDPKKYNPLYINRKICDSDYLLNYENDGILVKREDGKISLPQCRDYQEICGVEADPIINSAYYLFEISGEFFYEATELPQKIKEDLIFYKKLDELPPKKDDCKREYFYLRIHRFRELDPVHMVFAGATGYHLRNWRRANMYCGCCGAPTTASGTERAFVCTECGYSAYPQIAPAVIVAIINKDKLLLVRNLRRPKNVRLELVSGYVEIGESFEHAVHREVLEEVGLKVKNVRYYKDQPWGISGAHMVGYIAEVDGDDTVVRQEDEISEAKWYSREEIPEYRNRLSVGSEMILMFKEGKIRAES